MAKFNSATTKLAKTPLTREEALDRASRIYKDVIPFKKRNPNVNDERINKLVDIFDQLVTDHGITEDELKGTTTGLAPTTNQSEQLLDYSDENREPVSLYYSQPDAVEEREYNRANKKDRDHDLALPFKLGYDAKTGKFDKEEFKKVAQARKQSLSPEQYTEEARNAYGIGIEPEEYEKALSYGVPHDYLMQAHFGSMRPHTIQVGAANELDNIAGVPLSETLAGSAARMFRENNPLPTPPESKSTEMAESTGYVPVRISVMNPIHIAEAYSRGITSDELLDAWHSSGFHPLAGFGPQMTHPITKYITTRSIGNGISHEQAKMYLSSLKTIPSDQFARHLKSGYTPEQIVGTLNEYSDIPLPAAQSMRAISE